jgi:hypothetical protein
LTQRLAHQLSRRTLRRIPARVLSGRCAVNLRWGPLGQLAAVARDDRLRERAGRVAVLPRTPGHRPRFGSAARPRRWDRRSPRLLEQADGERVVVVAGEDDAFLDGKYRENVMSETPGGCIIASCCSTMRYLEALAAGIESRLVKGTMRGILAGLAGDLIDQPLRRWTQGRSLPGLPRHALIMPLRDHGDAAQLAVGRAPTSTPPLVSTRTCSGQSAC